MCVAATDDVEERIGFLEAGADDVIARPFDQREVEARVEALLLRFQRSKDLAPVVSPDGLTLARPRRTVAVYSPKGGVGTTTIATNIAVVAAQRKADRVILVDLSLQFGGVATHLNLEPKLTIADVIRDEAALREPDLLRSYAVRHDSGLHVLAAPATPEKAELITPDHVSHILGTLLEAYDAVVVDAGSVLDERALRIFETAETIVLPVHPEISALKAVHGLLDYLNEAASIGGEVDVRAEQHVRARASSSRATSRRRSARGSPRTCRMTRSSTSRPSTKACRSSWGRRARRRLNSSSG